MSRKTVSCSVVLVLIGWTLSAVTASAQHFHQVTGSLVSVAAGRNEVFGIDPKGGVWRYRAGTQSFVKIAKAQFTQIVVGGGTLSQLDEVWGVNNNSGAVYQFNYSSKTFNQIQPAPPLVQITVGAGTFDSCHPYEVWGIDPGGDAYRFDYCSGQFHLSPHSSLFQVAAGEGDVWGAGNDSTIYHYSFDQETFVQLPGLLFRVAVGVNDLWGYDLGNSVYRYDLNVIGLYRFDLTVNQVAAGGDGVWALTSAQNIYRFDSPSQTFVQIPGSLNTIAVGSGAGVWGVNSSNQVFTFVRP